MTNTKTVNAKNLLAKAIEKLSGYGITGNTVIGILECLLELAPDEAAQSGWIPCSERLPEEDGIYLVTYKLKNYGIELLHFSTATIGGGWIIPAPKCYTLKENNILAWQPLPEPYNPDHIRDTTKKVKEATNATTDL